jgi:hypothetical protein
MRFDLIGEAMAVRDQTARTSGQPARRAAAIIRPAASRRADNGQRRCCSSTEAKAPFRALGAGWAGERPLMWRALADEDLAEAVKCACVVVGRVLLRCLHRKEHS